MKVAGKILWWIIEAILIIYVICATTVLLCANKYGFTQFGKNIYAIVDENTIDQLTEFKENDVIEIKTVKYNDVNVGDKIIYYDTLNEKYILREGIVREKSGDNESAMYVLEGEGLTVSNQRLTGVYSGNTYSGLGIPLSILKSQIGFLLLVILPIFVLFIYQVYKIVILLKYDDEDDTTTKVAEVKEGE